MNPAARKLSRRLCAQCRQPFPPHRGNARFCSRECWSEYRICRGVPEVQAALQSLGVPLRAVVAA